MYQEVERNRISDLSWTQEQGQSKVRKFLHGLP